MAAASRLVVDLDHVASRYAAFSGCALPRNYVLGKPIGVGERTIVYRATHTVLGRTVAVKLLDPARAFSEDEVGALLRRAQTAAALTAPAALEIYDVGRFQGDLPYVAMELVRGTSLRRLALGRQMEPRRAVRIVLQCLAVIDDLHALGESHGRLDADHVFVEPRARVDRVKVALPVETWTRSAPSPAERAEGRRDDLRDAMHLLYELIAGSPPVSSDRGIGALEPLPSALRDVFEKGLAGEFETSEALAGALSVAVASDEGAAVHAPSGTTEGVRCVACGALGAGRHCGECGASLAPPAPRESPTVPSVRTTVGREDAISRLREIRHGLSSGLKVVELRGETGSGKTRLLQVVESEARADGDVVIVAEADPYRARVPGFAAAECLRSLWRVQGEQRAVSSDRVEAKDLRVAVRVASAFARSGRVVLLLDDADDWDSASLLAVAGLRNTDNSTAAERSVLIVLAARPDWPGLLRRAEVETLTLERLSKSAVGLLVGRDVAPALGRFDALTPLHAKQLEWFLREYGPNPPDELAEVVAARIVSTHAPARTVLEALAIAGRRLTMDELAALVGAEGTEGHVVHLQSRGLVSVRHDGLACAHSLIRAVALETTPLAARRLLSARVLAHLDDYPLEARVQVATMAGRAQLVCELARTAARRALDRGDQAASARFLELSLEAVREHAFLRRPRST